MPRSLTTRPKGAFRRAERWMVGIFMGILAFGLDKAIGRSLKRSGGSDGSRAATETEGTVATGRGGEIDLPPRT